MTVGNNMNTQPHFCMRRRRSWVNHGVAYSDHAGLLTRKCEGSRQATGPPVLTGSSVPQGVLELAYRSVQFQSVFDVCLESGR